MQKCCLRVKSPIDLKMLNDFQNIQRFSDFLQCQQSPQRQGKAKPRTKKLNIGKYTEVITQVDFLRGHKPNCWKPLCVCVCSHTHGVARWSVRSFTRRLKYILSF